MHLHEQSTKRMLHAVTNVSSNKSQSAYSTIHIYFDLHQPLSIPQMIYIYIYIYSMNETFLYTVVT